MGHHFTKIITQSTIVVADGHAVGNAVGIVVKLVLIASIAAMASCAVPKAMRKKSSEKSAHVNNKTKFSSKLYGVKGSPRVTTSKKVRKGGGRYQVGKPYKIKNKWYYPKDQPGYYKVGMASWYGPNFHGRLTANGEVYDQYSLSAAHPTLPLPSYAKVTNMENGSSVIVRINDRGPFSNKRIIDLSAQASKMLGYQNKGLTKVKVRYLGKARMDGLDAKYLMASYRPGRGQKYQRGAPIIAPGATQPGNLLANASMPAPVIGLGNNRNPGIAVANGFTQPVPAASQLLAIGFIPVPLLRPTPLYTGSTLNLAQNIPLQPRRLDPISFVGTQQYQARISQAFAAISANSNGNNLQKR